MLLAVAMVAVLSLMLAAAEETFRAELRRAGRSADDEILVKTATNEMTLVDWDVRSRQPPLRLRAMSTTWTICGDHRVRHREPTMQVKACRRRDRRHAEKREGQHLRHRKAVVVDGKTITYTGRRGT